MTFEQYNKPWIESIASCKKYIIDRESIDKMELFLENYESKLPLLPIPLIFEQSHYDELCQASTVLTQVQTKILRFLISEYSQEEILDMFDLPHIIKPLIDWEELLTGNKIIARFDIIPTKTGYQFCEINADSSIGGLKVLDCIKEYCSALGWPTNNLGSSPRKDIANHLRQMVKEHGFQRIVVFSLNQYLVEGSGTVRCLYESIADAVPEIPVLLVDERTYPDELLSSHEAKKTLLYRMAIYGDVNCHSLLEDIIAKGSTMINSFETEIRSNKRWFAIFHDSEYRKILTENELASILKFVPPTFILSPNNFEKTIKDKDHYVFKLNRSYGGEGVIIGADVTAETLKERIKDINRWTAQNLIESEEILLPSDETFLLSPNKIVLGLFRVLDKYSGMFVRASNKSRIVNITFGSAKITWAFSSTKDHYNQLLSLLPHSQAS